MSGDPHADQYGRRPDVHYGRADAFPLKPSPAWTLALALPCKAHAARPGDSCWRAVASICGPRARTALQYVKAGRRP